MDSERLNAETKHKPAHILHIRVKTRDKVFGKAEVLVVAFLIWAVPIQGHLVPA